MITGHGNGNEYFLCSREKTYQTIKGFLEPFQFFGLHY